MNHEGNIKYMWLDVARKEWKCGRIINNKRERERDLKKVTHIQRQRKTALKEKEKVKTLK